MQRNLVTSLGGRFHSDLDRSVHVLVVGMTGTEKYKVFEFLAD